MFLLFKRLEKSYSSKVRRSNNPAFMWMFMVVVILLTATQPSFSCYIRLNHGTIFIRGLIYRPTLTISWYSQHERWEGGGIAATLFVVRHFRKGSAAARRSDAKRFQHNSGVSSSGLWPLHGPCNHFPNGLYEVSQQSKS